MENSVVIALGIIIILAFIIYISNQFNRLIIKIKEAESDIDVSLVKRHDVLLKLVEVVKSYSKHEKNTLIKIVEVRKNMTIPEKEKVAETMDKDQKKLEIIVENYPELKASENYLSLQKSIVDTEDHLQASRRMYNSNVSLYNQYLSTFPYVIIGKFKGLKKKEYLNFNDENTTKVEITTEK